MQSLKGFIGSSLNWSRCREPKQTPETKSEAGRSLPKPLLREVAAGVRLMYYTADILELRTRLSVYHQDGIPYSRTYSGLGQKDLEELKS